MVSQRVLLRLLVNRLIPNFGLDFWEGTIELTT